MNFRNKSLKKVLRIAIPIGCLLIIIFRIIFPETNFDSISLGLLVICIFWICIDDPEQFFSRIRKIKFPFLEMELGSIETRTDKIEKEMKIKKDISVGLSGSAEELEKYSHKEESYFHTNILDLSFGIENSLRKMYQEHFKTTVNQSISVVNLIEILTRESVLNSEISDLLKRFWSVRNEIVHNQSVRVGERNLMYFINIGLRISSILKAIIGNQTDPGLPHQGLGDK